MEIYELSDTELKIILKEIQWTTKSHMYTTNWN